MNTRDLPDSNFDAIFKKASDSIEFKFDESNWNALDKKLDNHYRITKILWSLIIGILVIAIGVTLYTINSDAFILFHTKNQAIISNNFYASNNKTININEEKNTSTQGDVKVFAKKINYRINQVQHKSTTRLFQEESGITNQYTETPLLKTGNINEVRSHKPDFTFEKEFKSDLILSSYYNTYYVYSVNPKFSQKSSKNFISLNINLGPEISGVNIREAGLGTSRGIGIEYFLSDKFSIASGINYVKKKYSVSKGEYSLPVKSISNYKGTPRTINVSCDVIDIPLNFYFAILQNSKGRLSIGAGSSSYLMLQEVYDYNYGSYNSVSRTYKIKNENQHYFGVMNLSMAYTRAINHRFAWQIEPYYKIPITKIAEAGVNLNTIGVNVILKYKLSGVNK